MSVKDDVLLMNVLEQESPYYQNPVYGRYRAHMKKFVDEEILPHIDKWEKKEKIPREFWNKCHSRRIYANAYVVGKDQVASQKRLKNVPEFLIGHPLPDPFLQILWNTEICRAGSGGLMTGVFVHSIAVPPVLHFGTKKQIKMFEDVITAKKLSCLAISEPGAGSDVRNIKTKAVLDPKTGDYIVSGEKYWISGGTIADYFVTAVRTGGKGIHGISLMLIERKKGVITTKLPLQGHALGHTAYVVFKNVRVSPDMIIGKLNEGFKPIMFNFNQERFGIACGATWYVLNLHISYILLGYVILNSFCKVLIDNSVKYAQTRKTFGKALIKHQVIRHKLAEMTRQTLATWSMMERCAYQLKFDPIGRKDKSIPRNIALFKVQATKCLEFCAREASQIFGGRSYVRGGRGAKIDRIYRDVRAYAIYGGSEEIMLDLAARQAKL